MGPVGETVMLRFLISAFAAVAVLGASPLHASEEISFFRIATGGVGGTYYPVGGLIAQAISNPPGSRPCDKGGSCGVPGLVAVAQSSHGSVANIAAIGKGQVDSGFAQSDIAFWAHSGTGTYAKSGKIENIRAIASLYPESIHLVAAKGSGIRSVRDLKGKRVSLDEEGSGTLVDARLILAAFGLSEKSIKPVYVKSIPAAEKMIAGELDAFFVVAGYPASSIAELAKTHGAELIPIAGPEIEKMTAKYPFLTQGVIPAGSYEDMGEVATVNVRAQWVVSAAADEERVYQITKALWNQANRALLDSGHPQGKAITLETALDGIAIPLHPGAERFYEEAGLIKPNH